MKEDKLNRKQGEEREEGDEDEGEEEKRRGVLNRIETCRRLMKFTMNEVRTKRESESKHSFLTSPTPQKCDGGT